VEVVENENTSVVEKSQSSVKSGKKRTRRAPNPSEALSILRSSAFRAQKHGISFALVNIPSQKALGIVISNSWHCSKCLEFFFGEMPKSEKCPKCEGK
jgi:DnaJ-class molecular chaperone